MTNCSKLPDYTGIVNTGHNMSILLTGEATNKFSDEFEQLKSGAKMFAVNTDTGELVGVSPKFLTTGGLGLATNVAVWGVDPYGNEVPKGQEDSPFWQKYAQFNGCERGEAINLYLLNGLNLYSITHSTPITYATDGVLPLTQNVVDFKLICSYEATPENLAEAKQNLDFINNSIQALKSSGGRPSASFIGANGERTDEGMLATLGVTKEATEAQIRSLEGAESSETTLTTDEVEVKDTKTNILLGAVILLLVYSVVKKMK